MSLVHDVSGMAGIHVLRALAVVALLAFLQLTAAAYTTPVRAAGVALPAIVATAAQWGERPQLAGLVLLAATTWLWSRARRDATVPWLVIPLTWVWAMLHGSWVIGVATGALFVVAMLLERPRRERAWARLVGVVAASLAVAGADPARAVAAARALRGRSGGARPGERVGRAGADQPARHRRGPDGADRARCARCATCGPASRSCSSPRPGSPSPPRPCARSRSARCWWCRRWRRSSPVDGQRRVGTVRERLSPWPLVVTGALLLAGARGRHRRALVGAAARARSTPPWRSCPQVPSSPSSRPPRAGCSGSTPRCGPCATCAPRCTPAPVGRGVRVVLPGRAGLAGVRGGARRGALVLVDGSALDRAVRSDAGWQQVARDG